MPDYSIAVGAPSKVVKNRKEAWEAGAADRAKYVAALEDIARKKAAAETRAAELDAAGAPADGSAGA